MNNLVFFYTPNEAGKFLKTLEKTEKLLLESGANKEIDNYIH